MKTREAATKLGYDDGYVTKLIRDGKLKATKKGQRPWDVDPESVEAYLLKRDRKGPVGNSRPEPLAPAKEPTRTVALGSDAEASVLIRELEREGTAVAGEVATMAKLFWWLSEFLLAGMEPASIFPTALSVLPRGAPDGGGKAANYVARELMFKLRALGLVCDEGRMQGHRGYTVVVCTELGRRVVQALMARNWPRPRL